MLSLLAEKAFEAITVREIAERAGIGYATFFRHYAGLEECLGDVAAEQIDQLLAHTVPLFDVADSLASCEALCAYVETEHILWHALLAGGAWPRVRATFIAKAEALVPRLGRDESDIPPDLAVIFATSGVLDILSWWLRGGMRRPPAEIAGFIDRLAVAAVVRG